MGSLTRISESPACAATTNVGRVVVAVPAGFDHGDVGRVDEDVAVAVVALELHEGWNIRRLRWDAGFQTQKAFANHLGVPPPQVHPVTGGFRARAVQSRVHGAVGGEDRGRCAARHRVLARRGVLTDDIERVAVER